MTRPDARAYIELFEKLSPERIRDAEVVVHPAIHFKDPFNDFVGIDLFRKLLDKVLNDVSAPNFIVTRQVRDGDVLFLRWIFSGTVARLGFLEVTGMSEIRFDREGRVIEHVDHWDASEQFYARLPVIGGLIRLIRGKIKVS